MKKTAATTLAMLLSAGVLGCDMEQQETEQNAPAAAEQEGAPAVTSEEPQAMALRVASLEEVGTYITDADGRALYAIEGAPEGESTCYDACAEEWPPLLATGDQSAPGAAELQADLLGTLQRQDGQQQVTYAGHALYYYHDDQGPGQVEGQDVTDSWGEWYLVRPDGELLEGQSGS